MFFSGLDLINKSTDNNASLSYDQFILQGKTTLFGPVNNKIKYVKFENMLFCFGVHIR